MKVNERKESVSIITWERYGVLSLRRPFPERAMRGKAGVRVRWAILTQVGNSVTRFSEMGYYQRVAVMMDDSNKYSLQRTNLKPYVRI